MNIQLIFKQFQYYLPFEKRQSAFDNASKLLYDAFPKHYTGQRVIDRWAECQLYVQHVIALNERYLQEDCDLAPYRPTAEFVRLMSHAAWYICSDRHPVLVIESLTSDRYLFELARTLPVKQPNGDIEFARPLLEDQLFFTVKGAADG